MTESIKVNRIEFFEPAPAPPQLNSTQEQVYEILSAKKHQKHSLGDWYLGAIYAAKNTYNPDRFCQAAQSLRELLEKLPRVFDDSAIQVSRPDFKKMREDLLSRLCSDKKRYDEKWIGKTVDADLDRTIRDVEKYFKLNQVPTRREQIHSVMSKTDPMYDALGHGIRLEKTDRFYAVWSFFEALAHHNSQVDEKEFWQQLSQIESIVIDLLAPIIAQDQGDIRAILEKPQPEQGDIEKMLELIKRCGANYVYFFKTADNPVWINHLLNNGFLKNPPSVEVTEDGYINTPTWWPIFYLKRVSERNPEQVVEIILGLEKTDNPIILREIFSIAFALKDIALSLRLKPLVKQFLESLDQWDSWDKVDFFVKIIKKWGSAEGPSRQAAYEIIQEILSNVVYEKLKSTSIPNLIKQPCP